MPSAKVNIQDLEVWRVLKEGGVAVDQFRAIREIVAEGLTNSAKSFTAEDVEVLVFIPEVAVNANLVTVEIIFSTDDDYNPSYDQKKELALKVKQQFLFHFKVRHVQVKDDQVGVWPMPQYGAVYV